MFPWQFLHVAAAPGSEGAALTPCFGRVDIPSGASATIVSVFPPATRNRSRVALESDEDPMFSGARNQDCHPAGGWFCRF